MLSCSMSSGALESPDLLLSCSVIVLALHNTIILIITHLSTPKSIKQLINWSTDTGAIAKLTHKDGEVYASSSNGSVRSYILSHNPSRIKLNKTYWDHSRRVNAVMFGLPSIGPCRLHGTYDVWCIMYNATISASVSASASAIFPTCVALHRFASLDGSIPLHSNATQSLSSNLTSTITPH